jgi:outer membrane protein OmpA-like peptidoglycan-associated protein
LSLIGFRAKLKAGAAKSGGRNRHAPCTSTSRALIAAALIVSTAVISTSAAAQDPSTGDIVNSLQPKTKFRSFDPNQAAEDAKQTDLVKRLQNVKTRQITVEERQEITEVVEENDLPAIDLEVFFNFDSAEITPEGLPILKKLGAALSVEKLKGSVFLVAGHTDAKGSDACPYPTSAPSRWQNS